MAPICWVYGLSVVTWFSAQTGIQAPKIIRVSGNHRYLVTEDGQPFFYLADTAWELFHRLNREEAEHYLTTRQRQGFTVIQAVALAEFDGLRVPNAYGHLPLINNDPTKLNEAYFQHVDFVVHQANQRGLVVGLLPTWGDKWNKKWGVGPEIFTPENARIYGRLIGQRYRDRSIIWITGGDRPIENDRHRAIVTAMAQGLREGDGGTHLITFHPTGGSGSSQYFHAEDWLSFNMRQNGHNCEYTKGYFQTRVDYDRKPIKPVIDGEPIYEGHPVSFNAKELGHSMAADCRRAFYWDMLSGACGHTYGHHSIWQFYDGKRAPVNAPLMPWREALSQPGAGHVCIGRRLIESRPMESRIPDDTVLVADRVATSVPGSGTRRFVSARDARGRYAMVYVPVGKAFQVKMYVIKAKQVQAWWFDPRNGTATLAGSFPATGIRTFTSPSQGELLDWILVLDATDAGFLPPGQLK
jgi:hypothetical protein